MKALLLMPLVALCLLADGLMDVGAGAFTAALVAAFIPALGAVR